MGTCYFLSGGFMRTICCDICATRTAKLVKAFRYFTWKNAARTIRVRLDLCDGCLPEVKRRVKEDLKTAEQAQDWVSRGLPVSALVAKS